MFKFLFVMFFFFILLVFLMGFSILRAFKNILFGSGGNTKKKSEGHHRQNSNNNYSEQRNTKEYSHASSRKKIFTKDEGEYVDYEEVK